VDDGVIDPMDTRSMLALGLSAAYNAAYSRAALRGFSDVSSSRKHEENEKHEEERLVRNRFVPS